MVNLIILDASGSMNSKLEEVKGGLKQLFNQIKEDTKKDKKLKIQTIVTDFGGAADFNVIVNTKKSAELSDEIVDKYSTRGMTALFDAIGKSFLLVPLTEKDVFVNILTDGGENDSKEFKLDIIKALIAEKKSKGWAITFMGTSEADLANAERIGISKGNTYAFQNSAAGVKMSFSKLSSTRSMYMDAKSKGKDIDLANLMEDDEKLNGKI